MCKNKPCKLAGIAGDTIAPISIADMNNRVAAVSADIESLAATIEEKLAIGPSAAQSQRLVAVSLIKVAQPLLQQVSNSVAYIMSAAPEADEGATVPADFHTDALLEGVLKLVDGIAEAIASQFGVEESAIAPFIVATNSIMLPLVEYLVARAKAAMADADALSV